MQDKLIVNTAKLIEQNLLDLRFDNEELNHTRSNLALIATGYIIRYDREGCYSSDRRVKAYAFFERATAFIEKYQTYQDTNSQKQSKMG